MARWAHELITEDRLYLRAGIGLNPPVQQSKTPPVMLASVRHYPVDRPLGAGGMGEVFLAQDTRLDRPVALKFLCAESAADARHRQRFLVEAKAVAALNHPNICTIYDVGEAEDGRPFIAMELLEGETLGARLKRASMGMPGLIDVGLQVAEALAAAHARGIVHRDIKPSNLHVTTDDRVKILDFGLAKRMTAASASEEAATLVQTQAGQVLGTPNYMSPEQALGKEVDARTDLFSLGAVLYEMVTGRAPFAGRSVSETLERILHGTPEGLARFNDAVPAELERVILKCLRRPPGERYQSARELMVDLRSLKENLKSAEARRGAEGTGQVVTLVFMSTNAADLERVLGPLGASQLSRAHELTFEQQLEAFPHAEMLDMAGNTTLLSFARPSSAVQFALAMQLATIQPLTCRMGIHLGEVVDGQAMEPRDKFGEPLVICERLLQLAKPGQLLMSRAVFDSARPVLRREEVSELSGLQELHELTWLNHGPYRLEGIADAVEICEVGASGQKAGGPPATSAKAQRQVTPGDEQVLGWRPALGQLVPNTQWLLEQKLGEGGFGEVWLGRHETLKERRVFKFCFRADRVRSLKREMTLFRLLKERIGDHPNIVRLLEVCFDEPPFYIVMDHVEGSDLKVWCEAQGGAAKAPLEVKLEIVAQVADALQAAHDAGVIHRDVKPGNILVAHLKSLPARQTGEVREPRENIQAGTDASSLSPSPQPSPAGRGGNLGQSSAESTRAGINEAMSTALPLPAGEGRGEGETSKAQSGSGGSAQSIQTPRAIQAKLTDFGIGQVVSQEVLAGITKTGFTQTIIAESSSSQTGSQMYMAPELLAGKPASTRSDIYSLGVVLYQLLVGDLTRPLTTDWANDISDPLLRDDLKHCFAGNPQERFAGAGQLAANLRDIPQRRRALAKQQVELAAREGAAYRRGMMRIASVAVLIVAAVSLLALVAVRQSRLAQDRERENRQLLYVSDMNLAHRALKEGNIRRAEALLEAHVPKQGDKGDFRSFEWFSLRQLCRGDHEFSFPPHTYTPLCVAFSPDGQLLATGSGNRELIDSDRGELKLFNLNTRREMLTLPQGSASVTSVAFSRDSQTCVAGKSDGTIMLWNIAKQQPGGLLTGHTKDVRTLSVSPSGHGLASGSYDGTFRLWDMLSRREEQSVSVGYAISSVAFAPDGKKIAVAGDGLHIKILDVATASQMYIPWPDTHILSLAFSPNGKILAVANNNSSIRLVDVTSAITDAPKVTNLGQHQNSATSLAFSPDGSTLVSASSDHTLKLWDVLRSKELAVLKGHRGNVRQIAFSPDGATLASVGDDKTVKLWRASPEPDTDALRHSAWVRSANFSGDGKWLVTGSWDGTIRLWDVTTKQVTRTLSGQTGIVHHVLFSKDSKLLISGGEDQTIKIWDPSSSREEPLAILSGHRGSVFCLGLSPDGGTLVSANGEWGEDNPGVVKFWDLANRQERASFLAHPNGIRSMAISANGRLLATGSWDQTIKLWDFRSQKVLGHFKFRERNGAVSSLAFSPDGKILASGSEIPTLVFWDVAKGEKLHTFDGIVAGVEGLVFTSDGKTLIETCSNGSVTLLNVATRKELLTLHGHEGFLGIPVFSPDGRVLASPGADHTVRLWPAGHFLQDRSEEVSTAR